MSKSLNSTSLLDQLSCDLNNLYCITRDSRIENLFVKIAQGNEGDVQEFLNQLYDGKFKNLKQYKSIIDVIKILQSKEISSLTSPQFVTKVINEYKPYITTIICLGQLRNLNLPILHPISKQLSLTSNFGNRPQEEVEAVLTDLKKINDELQHYLKAKYSSEYEDEFVAKQPKQTTKEKIKTMTMFLLDRFSGEVTNGFQNSELSSIASKIGNALLFPSQVLKLLFQVSPDIEVSTKHLQTEAFDIVTNVLKSKKIEPHNYEANYSYIKGRIFSFTQDITPGQFYTYYQKILMREKSKTYGISNVNDDTDVEDFNINPDRWTNPMAIILLSLVLSGIDARAS